VSESEFREYSVELERIKNEAMILQNKLELKEMELEDHQKTVSKYK
jgi:hypothetical protein